MVGRNFHPRHGRRGLPGACLMEGGSAMVNARKVAFFALGFLLANAAIRIIETMEAPR